MNRKNITVIIKPTKRCNLRCKYCYEHTNNIPDMSLDLYKLIQDKLIKKYDRVKFIWHGGEPTIMGLPFYRKVVELQNAVNSKGEVQIANGIQTNGTLLDSELIEFYINNKFNIGFSFDGLENEVTRGQTEKTLTSIKYLQSKGISVSAIKVITRNSLNTLIDEYKYFNSLNLNMKISYVFSSENAIANNLLLETKQYCSSIIDLFDYWVEDQDGKIKIFEFINLILLSMDRVTGSCETNSCMMDFLGIDQQGNIYPCGRVYPSEYCLGNINEIDTIDDAFASDGFKNLMMKSVERRRKCINECDIYDYCHGGCNHNALIENGLTHNKGFSCLSYKTIFTYVKNFVDNNDLSKGKNPIIRKIYNETLNIVSNKRIGE